MAESDLDEIWWHVAQDGGTATADRLIDDIAEQFSLLAEHPLLGRERNDIIPNLRSLPVRSHVIYDRPDDDGVVIARVLHGKRDQGEQF